MSQKVGIYPAKVATCRLILAPRINRLYHFTFTREHKVKYLCVSSIAKVPQHVYHAWSLRKDDSRTAVEQEAKASFFDFIRQECDCKARNETMVWVN